MIQKTSSLFDWKIVGPAIGDAFKKLDPRIPTEYPDEFGAEGEALRNQLLKWRIDHVFEGSTPPMLIY